MPRLALLLALFALARSSFALNPMLARRSIAKFKPGPVPAPVVAQALDAAVLAPCHFLTEPWRFYNVGPQTVEKLCAHNEDKRAAYEAVPGWMVITVATEYGEDGTISTKKVSVRRMNFLLYKGASHTLPQWWTGRVFDSAGCLGCHLPLGRASRITPPPRALRRTSCSRSPQTASAASG